MRKLILLEHMSLDGFVGGPNGEMDWITIEDKLFDVIGNITHNADTAIYGRVTYEMMEAYWPTAADQPGATRHDIEHGNWANKASKIVVSTTLKKTNWQNTKIISGNIADEINQLKQQAGKNIIMIGSPRLAQSFIQLGLIDEYYISLNPVVLAGGIPLFGNVTKKADLRLSGTTKFDAGIVLLHYETRR